MDRGNSQRTLGALKQSLLSSECLENPQFFEFDAIKTAEKELETIDNDHKVFDMNHSGAVLTWKYLSV